MRELSVAEQRYQAVLAVIGDGLAVIAGRREGGVSRQTLHAWLARYEAEGLEGLGGPVASAGSCPHQMPAEVEATLLELRRSRPYWGPRRLVFELAKRGVAPVPSESAAYRALVRAGMIDPEPRGDRRSRKWKRWERGRRWSCGRWTSWAGSRWLTAPGQGVDRDRRPFPDVCVGEVDGRANAPSRSVTGCAARCAAYGVPEQILTDNGKVFTGRFNHPPVEVLFDRICRENGIEHLLTQPRSPTTTGKIERFHRTSARGVPHRHRLSRTIAQRPAGPRRVGRLLQHRPAAPVDRDGHPQPQRFNAGAPPLTTIDPVERRYRSHRRSVGQPPGLRQRHRLRVLAASLCRPHCAGARCDVHVDGDTLRFWIGDQFVKTAARTSTGTVRKKRAPRTAAGP